MWVITESLLSQGPKQWVPKAVLGTSSDQSSMPMSTVDWQGMIWFKVWLVEMFHN